MPVFKVWSADREKKICVIATSLDEVKEKGLRKLGYPPSDVRLVLAEDGTEIDEEEILQEFLGAALIMLKQDQAWVKAASSSTTFTPSITPVSSIGTHLPVDPTVPTPSSPQTETILAESSKSHHDQVVSHQWKSLDSATITSEIISAPLPPFSDRVKHFLDTLEKPEPVWNVVIAEAAEYYGSKWPKIGERMQYQAIGEKITARYPCLKQDGKTPWSQFTKSLSQKIRHIRHQASRKSQDPYPKAVKVFRPSVKEQKKEYDEPLPSKDDITRHIKEIAEMWSKPKPKPSSQELIHTKQLLKATQTHRKQLLTDHPDGQLKPIFDMFPCFKEGSLITYELKLRLGVDRVKLFATNIKLMVKAVASIMTGEDKDLPKMEILFKYIEERTTKVRAQKDSFISIIEDVPDKGISKCLSTSPTCPLRLVVFLTDDEVVGSYIIGGNQIIKVSEPTCVLTGVFELVAAYYVFDIDYPRVYANPLGIIQEVALQEPHNQPTSKKYNFFLKELKSELLKVAVEEED